MAQVLVRRDLAHLVGERGVRAVEVHSDERDLEIAVDVECARGTTGALRVDASGWAGGAGTRCDEHQDAEGDASDGT
jgi:hypothetical protein